MDTPKVLAAIDRDWPAHFERYKKYLSQPSVSNTGEGVIDMANLLVEDFRKLGCQDVRLIETEGWPVVYASLDVGAEKTVMFYGMYDVQPVLGEVWKVPPFDATIVDDNEFGEVLMGRGARNQKGPLAGGINAIESILKEEGTLPVNIKFLIEGEEEMGSIHLPGVVEQLRSELQDCVCCFFHAFMSEPNSNIVDCYMGMKGIINVEFKLKGGDWGGPTDHSIHGGNAVWVDSPIWHAIRALATLKDASDRVLVEGFYDDVAGPLEGDREIVDELMTKWDMEGWKKEFGVRRFKNNMSPREAMDYRNFMPELNIDGIYGGYTGPGSKTLLANEVTVKMDIRTVPYMDPKKVIEQLKAHFTKLGIDDRTEVTYENAYNWCRMKVNEPCIQAMFSAMRELKYEPLAWITRPGSAPFSIFQSSLGLPIVFGGLGYSALSHSPNEFAVLQGVKDSEKFTALLLRNIAEM